MTLEHLGMFIGIGLRPLHGVGFMTKYNILANDPSYIALPSMDHLLLFFSDEGAIAVALLNMFCLNARIYCMGKDLGFS